TIGKELKHIEDAQLEDVKNFFGKHYLPNEAILCVAGDVTLEEVKSLAEKWFGDIAKGNSYKRALAEEPIQTAARQLTVEANVPLDAIYKAWHIKGRLHPDYYS